MARCSPVLLLLASAAAAAAQAATGAPAAAPLDISTALNSADLADMHDGCVHFQVIHSTNTEHFSKRAVELSLANRSDVAYYAKLNFGTPAQPQYVQLDTGSFELWINPTCSGLSSGDESFCHAVGSFDTAESSTLSALGTGKQLRYGIGTANISYVLDNIALPGTTSVLEQVQFGVATSTEDEFSGILGIGYGLGLTTRYPNFIDELQMQNITRVKAFSLALGSKSEQEGVIVFGGVDTSKFAGRLAGLPITPAVDSPDGVPRYWVNMTSLALTTPAGTTTPYPSSAMQVFLDSGSTLTLLPADLADRIAADFNATAAGSGFYAVDCSIADNTAGSLDFAFDGVTVRVPYSELIREAGRQCMLGIQASTDFVLLGDTFMRSAYVVIDQTDNTVWMAQYTNCGSTPAALASSATLRGLTGLCSETANVDTSTGATSGSSSSSGSSAVPSSSAGSSSSSSSSIDATPSSASGASLSNSTSSAASSVALLRGGTLAVAVVVAAVLGGVLGLDPWL